MTRPSSLPTENYIFDHAEPTPDQPTSRDHWIVSVDDDLGGGVCSSGQYDGAPLTLGGLIAACVFAGVLATLALFVIATWQERPQAPAYVATETHLRCLECGEQIRSINDPTGSGVCRVCRMKVARVQWGAQ